MRQLRHRQQGIVAVLVAIGLLALLAMAGLAIDTGQLVLNKSRLQSTVDAAALAAAKRLDETGSEAQASVAASQVFTVNADRLRGASGAEVTVQYSSTLSPFVDGSSPANYVRVRANNLSWRAGFIRALGFDRLATGASAVAGPSAPIGAPCDLVPLAVCAVKGSTGPWWGYVPYGQTGSKVYTLKDASKDPHPLGEGNFGAIDVGSGARDVEYHLAAGAWCADPIGEDVPSEPGNMASIRDGFNTRFGIPSPPKYPLSLYPPDHVVTPKPNMPLASDGTTITANGQPVGGIGDVPYSYKDYLDDYERKNFGYPYDAGGRPQRRIVTVPIIANSDCNLPGKKDRTIVGFGSFFLLQQICEPGGKGGLKCAPGTDGQIFAEFLGEGSASGTPGPTGGYGVYKIVLHNDPDSADS